MTAEDIRRKIIELRIELERLIAGGHQLTDIEVLERVQEISRLSIRYAILTGQDPTSHSESDEKVI